MRDDLRPRMRSYGRRRSDEREELPRILIVCEGKKTEPNYFRAFRVPGVDLKVIGAGDNTTNLVLIAAELSEKENYDQIWCVMDRDSFPAQRFNAAIAMAPSRNIRVAYSNEAFELWYLLHYDYLQSGLPRDAYGRLLSNHLGRPYRKNDPNMFDALRTRVEEAIRNARKLHKDYSPCDPESDNPSTTVYLLVEELLRYSR